MQNMNFAVISSEDITTGAASASSSAAPTGTTHARLSALTNPCRVRTGKTPTAVAADTLIKATDGAVFWKVAEGDKVAALQEGAAGELNVTFVKASPF